MKTYHLILLLLSFFSAFAQAPDTTTFSTACEQLPSGPKIEYVEQGDPSGIPVILLHGFTDSWHSYELVLPYLPPSLHVYALSMRGHGNSGKPAMGYLPEDFARDVHAFMQAKQIDNAVIVGHSMGATIAQYFAVNYPEHCRGLVLISAFLSFSDKPDLVAFADVVQELQEPVGREFVAEFQQSTLFNAVPDAFYSTVVAESMKLPAAVWQQTLQGLLSADYREGLPAIQVPALIIWGNKDTYTPLEDQLMLSKLIDGSHLHTYGNVGHGVHWEKPELFANELCGFIRTVVE